MEDKNTWIIAGIIIVALLAFMPWGNRYGYGGMMSMMYDRGYGYGMYEFGGIFMLLVLVLLVLAIVWIIRELQIRPSKR